MRKAHMRSFELFEVLKKIFEHHLIFYLLKKIHYDKI